MPFMLPLRFLPLIQTSSVQRHFSRSINHSVAGGRKKKKMLGLGSVRILPEVVFGCRSWEFLLPGSCKQTLALSLPPHLPPRFYCQTSRQAAGEQEQTPLRHSGLICGAPLNFCGLQRKAAPCLEGSGCQISLATSKIAISGGGALKSELCGSLALFVCSICLLHQAEMCSFTTDAARLPEDTWRGSGEPLPVSLGSLGAAELSCAVSGSTWSKFSSFKVLGNRAGNDVICFPPLLFPDAVVCLKTRSSLQAG